MPETPLLNLELRTQTLHTDTKGYATWEACVTRKVIPAREAAIVICDMWDNHWSRGAAERVNAMAPRMNEVLCAARAGGIRIIHAPSDTLDFYAGTPARERILAAPPVEPPQPLEHVDPPLPIDDSDGGSDTSETPWHKAWTHHCMPVKITQRAQCSGKNQEYKATYCAAFVEGHKWQLEAFCYGSEPDS
jgi:hypothetical protein